MSYLVKLAIAVAAVFSTIPVAHAIGGSVGCGGDWIDGPLGKAVTSGTPDEFRRAVTNWIDRAEKEDLGGLGRLQHFASSSARQRWRDKKTLDLLEGNLAKDDGCAPRSQVAAAIRAGNVEVMRFLVGTPMGVSPKVWPITMFHACEYSSSQTEETRARRREAVGLLLESGKVHVNARYRGETILQYCKEPELVTLFIERGAIMVERGEPGYRENLLDLAIHDAISTEEGGYTAARLHAVERARLFSRHLPPSIEGRRIEQYVRSTCNRDDRDVLGKPNTCRELSTFIKAAPGTFGQQ
jgi:hypothetical protein